MPFALVCAALLAFAPAFAHPHHARPRMVQSARQFIASLTPEQREKTVFAFDDEERFFWHYIPTDDIPGAYKRPRRGLMETAMVTTRFLDRHEEALSDPVIAAKAP